MTFDMVRKAMNADNQLARLKYCTLEKGYIPKNATDFKNHFDTYLTSSQLHGKSYYGENVS